MARTFMKSPAKGALMGVSLTGGWLLADLLLPDPWGDYLLYAAMAVVNIAIGLKLGKLYDMQNDKETEDSFDAENAANYEFRS
jgi:hypothetical protein